MPVLDFNAYVLYYQAEESGGYYDSNGDYVRESEGEWVCAGRCNAVPAGRNNLITLPDADGKQVAYSFTIILHNPLSREYVYGERLRLVTVNGRETRELTVKGFARYQHQCKIYA